MEDNKTPFILILILLLTLGGAVYTKGFTELSFSVPFVGNSTGGSAGNTEEAKAKAKDFISANLVQPGTEFTISSVEKEGSLYKVAVDLDGRKIESYMTADYKTFFPSSMPMTQEEAADAETGQDASEQQDIPKNDNPKVQLFTMSYCPYGNQAEDLMAPVVDLLGDSITVEPHYIFYENYQGGGPEFCLDEESKYCSMHGIAEANQDIRELCVYNNQQDKYWDFIANANEICTVDDIETCWTDAAQAANVNVSSVENCLNQNAVSYAQSEQKLTDELGVSGSPALFINGVKYQASRSSEAYKAAICGAFNTAPEDCSQTIGETDTAAPAGGCGT